MTNPSPCCKACLLPLDNPQKRGHKDGYDLLGCRACGTVTVDPFPTAEELTRYYQSYVGSEIYKSKPDKKIRRARRRLQRLMRLAPGKSFLDVGCNRGYTVKAATDLGLDARGIDIDAVACAAAKGLFGDRFTAISVQDYAAAGHKADIIYTSEVIEHVPDPDAFAAAISKILNDNGVLYLTCPDGGDWRLPQDISNWKSVHPPSHIVYFSRKGMKTLLARHGIEVQKFFLPLKPGMKLIARKKQA